MDVLMMTAESMLSKRLVLKTIVALYFFIYVSKIVESPYRVERV